MGEAKRRQGAGVYPELGSLKAHTVELEDSRGRKVAFSVTSSGRVYCRGRRIRRVDILHLVQKKCDESIAAVREAIDKVDATSLNPNEERV